MKYSTLCMPLVALMIILFARCTQVDNQSIDHFPGDTPVLVGKLLQPDGKKPATNATVTLQHEKTLASITGTTLNKKAAAVTAVTDRSGNFSIASVDSGRYILEGMDNNGNAFRSAAIDIGVHQSPLTRNEDTLKKTGTIRGTIRLQSGGDPKNTFILAFGSDHFTQVRSDGTFLFDHLAEGIYDLKIVCIIDGYGYYDTSSIVVTSGNSTVIDTITLAMQELYRPQNATIHYDTMRQYALLAWDTASSVTIGGYHVYRRDIDSSDTYAATPLDSDATAQHGRYIDTTIIQDHSYEYRIAAVARDGTIGKKSLPVQIHAIGWFTRIDTLSVPASLGNVEFLGVAANEKSEIVTTYSTADSIYIAWYDANCSLRKCLQVKTPGPWRPSELTADNSGVVYLYSPFPGVYAYDSAGALLFKNETVHWAWLHCDVIGNTFYMAGKLDPTYVKGSMLGMTLKMKEPGVFDTIDRFEPKTNPAAVDRVFQVDITEYHLPMLSELSARLNVTVTDFGLFYRAYQQAIYNRTPDTGPNRICFNRERELLVYDFHGTLVLRFSFGFLTDLYASSAYVSDNRIIVGNQDGVFVLNRR